MGAPGEAVVSVRDAVGVLYRNDGQRLWRAVAAYAGDRSIADEALAEAFAQLLRRGEDVRDPGAWVWRAAFRIAGGELQRRHYVAPVVAERCVEDPEPAWGLVEALRTLSDQQRAVVVLRDYVGHSSKETAEIIGTSEPTVRVQLTRARRALRKELS